MKETLITPVATNPLVLSLKLPDSGITNEFVTTGVARFFDDAPNLREAGYHSWCCSSISEIDYD